MRGGIMKAYCVKCGTHREMKDTRNVINRKNKPAIKGVCTVCGSGIYKQVKVEVTSNFREVPGVENRNKRMQKENLMANKKGKESQHEILEKPLPQILDEITKSVVVAEKAAANARKAADEARLAGENAAEKVMRRFRKIFLKMVEDITEELSEGKH
jgi:hypothetical protein